MSTSHEIILGMDDLATIAIQCAGCRMQTSWDLDDKPQHVPKQCPGCGEKFEDDFRNAVEALADSRRFLAKKRHTVFIRVRHEPAISKAE